MEPTVQIIQRSFWQTKKGITILAVSLGLVIFLIIFALALNLPFFSKKPDTDLAGFPVKITLSENYGLQVGELTMNCPVESAFCKSQRLINLRNIDTVAYKAASGSGVLNLTDIATLENIAVLTNKQVGKKYFYESVVSKDGKSCYTIAYTLPADATFQNILNLEILNNKGSIARLGSQTFEAANEGANVLIQVRNTPLDPGIPCSLLKKSPEFFQSF